MRDSLDHSSDRISKVYDIIYEEAVTVTWRKRRVVRLYCSPINTFDQETNLNANLLFCMDMANLSITSSTDVKQILRL